MGLIDAFSRWFRKLREGFYKGIKPKRVWRIYMYEVRVSGYVIPPKSSQRKTRYSSTTTIQFELSFEERPYFRTFISDPLACERRYGNELENLVKALEKHPKIRRLFTYFEQIPKSQLTLEDFMAVAESRRVVLSAGPNDLIKVFGKPKFVVTAISFEPVGYFDVSEDEFPIVKGEASDTFIFKTYRPNEDVPYAEVEDEFIHSLA